MINNFDKIKTMLSFDSDEDYYFIQLIRRKKENPNITQNDKPIKNYYVFSMEQYDSIQEEIIEMCDKENARAYIRINKRNKHKVAVHLLSYLVDYAKEDKNYVTRKGVLIYDEILNLTQLLKDNQYDTIFTQYNSIISIQSGQLHSDKDKKWIIDYDIDPDMKSYEVTIDFTEVVIEAEALQKEARKIPMSKVIRTKNGYHLITRPFNLQNFSRQYDIHKDGLTLLYIS